MLGMTQEIRKKIGKDFGDSVDVTIEKDEEERTVEIPDDFLEALKGNPIAIQIYEKLSFSRKKEYITWITQTKKIETRQSRIAKALERLEAGKTLK